jgi:hypothetical protein
MYIILAGPLFCLVRIYTKCGYHLFSKNVMNKISIQKSWDDHIYYKSLLIYSRIVIPYGM